MLGKSVATNQKLKVHKLVPFIVLAGLATTLSGCLSTGISPAAVAATSQINPQALTAAQLLAPLKGGLIGSAFGDGLTPSEKQRGLVAEYQALETSFGQAPVTWVDKITRNSGEVIAGAPYRVGLQDCRPFTHKLTRVAVVTNTSGSACRQTNGSWLLLQ